MFLVLAESAFAGWSTNAWPSESRWQHANVHTQVWCAFETRIATNASGVYTQSVITTIVASTNYASGQPYFSSLVKTNLYLDIRERRAYEAHLAANERFRFTRLMYGADDTWPTPTYFYRSERENLLSIKQWMQAQFDTDVAGYYMASRIKAEANGGNFHGMAGTEELWYGAGPTNGWIEVLSNIGAPTNYFDFTPWRGLNGGGRQYSRVTTNTFILVATNGAAGPPFTNVVTDMWGQSITLVGTNRQTIITPVTNNSILAGFTTGDYGWKYVTNIMNRMAWPLWSGLLQDDGVTNAYVNFLAWDDGKAPVDFHLELYRYNPPTFDPWTLDGDGDGFAGDTNAVSTRSAPVGGLDEHFVFYPEWEFP